MAGTEILENFMAAKNEKWQIDRGYKKSRCKMKDVLSYISDKIIILILILTWCSGSKAEGQSLTSTLCWKRILITMEGALYTMM